MDDLTAFQRDLLYVISDYERPHGLKIKRDLVEYYEDGVNHSRLYPNLDTLVEKGLVEKGAIDERTNSYELTRNGRRALQARRTWENQRLDEVLMVPEGE